MRVGVGNPVNLLSLARAAVDADAWVPGTDLSVRRIDRPAPHQGAAGAWLAVLDGRLIIDLPHGDFRILERGDALHLPAGVPATLQGVEGAALVLWRAAAQQPAARDPH